MERSQRIDLRNRYRLGKVGDRAPLNREIGARCKKSG